MLHADEEQLDRAAIALRGGTAFVVAVCPAELRKAALERLRVRVKDLALPDPVEVGSPEESMIALIEQVGRRDRVLSLVLGRDVEGALDGLNLHREKVVRGAPVVLWLEDIATLTKMRERAPDAFSFRSTMVMIKGDGGPASAPLKTEDGEAVAQAKRRLKRARTPIEKADAGQRLAEELRCVGRVREAEEVAQRALLEISLATNDDYRLARATLYRRLSTVDMSSGKMAQALYWVGRALTEIDLVPFAQGLELRVRALGECPGPWGNNERSTVEEALRLVRTYGLAPDSHAFALRSAAVVALAVGDVRRARMLCDGFCAVDPPHKLNAAIGLVLQGDIDEVAGKFSDAEARYREASVVAAEGEASALLVSERLANCMAVRGELDAAERLIADDGQYAEVSSSLLSLCTQAQLALRRGDVRGSVEVLRRLVQEAYGSSLDSFLLDACRGLVDAAVEAHDAERLSSQDVAAILVESDVTRELILSLSGPAGPAWYPIQLHTLRSRLLALTPDTLDQSLDLAHQALDLARRTYPDLLPETGRTLADNLLRAAQPDDALAVIADVEPYASQHGFLKERARLLADRVLALVQRGDAPAIIDPHLTALRSALAATDSPRITAETLRDLALRLPPCAFMPDPLALAEEVHPLFVAMPMPAEDARCLELMGDVLQARGRPDEAKRRYVAARTRLQRYGLGLRLPLLEKKIAALA